MPNVRYSSGAIGTIRLPISGSFIQSLSSRTSAIVVATLLFPEPCLRSEYTSSPGTFSGLARMTRFGIEPPSWRRRSSMYSISGDFSCRGGRTGRCRCAS